MNGRGDNLARRGLKVAAALLGLLCAGCSYQSWYEGLRDSRRQDCYRLPPGEVRPCLDEVERVDYDRYRREREEATGKKSGAAEGRDDPDGQETAGSSG